MLSRADAWLARAEEHFIAALLLIASAVLFVNVVARYVFSTAVLGAEELVRFMIVWLVFVGGSVAARKGIHIGIDAILKLVGEKASRFISIIVFIISITFCIALAYFGVQLVASTYEFGQRSSALRLPFWIAQAAIPAGATLMAVRFLQRLVSLIRSRDKRSELEMIG